MRVSPRDLRAVRAGGLVTRYAVLGEGVFVIVELAATGSAGTLLEEPCQLEHWGLVLRGEVAAVEEQGTRTLSAGTAFYVRPGPTHRLEAPGRAVIAGFAPISEPIDDRPAALRARGIEPLRGRRAKFVPPSTIRVDALPTHTTRVGLIETLSAPMGEWLFTRSAFGPLSGFGDTWCDLPHWGLMLAGDAVLRWEDGDLELLSPGDAFHTPLGPPGHRLEVADAAIVADYTPIACIDDSDLRRAPRSVAARGADPTTPQDPERVPV